MTERIRAKPLRGIQDMRSHDGYADMLSDAKDGPSSQIIVKAPLLKTDATPEEKLNATAALRDTITEALSPDRAARPAVGRDGPSPRSFTRGPGEPPSNLHLMFRMQGRDLSGR